MKTYRLLSALLDYPTDELLANLSEAIAEAGGAAELVLGLDAEGLFDPEERQAVALFTQTLLSLDPTEAQARYVQTFDLTPEHSLHLTHHLFGEEKTRGPALIDLSEYYKAYGLEHDEKELPDFLPLILEFLSGLEPDEMRVFLGDTAKVLRVLAANLEKSGSPYAPLIRIIENHGSLAKLAV